MKAARDEKFANEAAPRPQGRARVLKRPAAAVAGSDVPFSNDAISGSGDAHVPKRPDIGKGTSSAIAASAVPKATSSAASVPDASSADTGAVPKSGSSTRKYVEYEELPDVEKG